MSKTAEEFWKTREEYPPVTCNFTRRYLDLGIVLKYINNVTSILDLGCGEGQLLLMLRELTDIKDYYGYDLSQVFIDNLVRRWGDCPGLKAVATNLITTEGLPKTDMCVCMGALLYVLDDADLKHLLSNILSDLLIMRVPCSLDQRMEINKFSEDYGADYAAVYRTIPEYMAILSEFFKVQSIDRCYPDEIESKYGTKQFFFVCTRLCDDKNME